MSQEKPSKRVSYTMEDRSQPYLFWVDKREQDEKEFLKCFFIRFEVLEFEDPEALSKVKLRILNFEQNDERILLLREILLGLDNERFSKKKNKKTPKPKHEDPDDE